MVVKILTTTSSLKILEKKLNWARLTGHDRSQFKAAQDFSPRSGVMGGLNSTCVMLAEVLPWCSHNWWHVHLTPPVVAYSRAGLKRCGTSEGNHEQREIW